MSGSTDFTDGFQRLVGGDDSELTVVRGRCPPGTSSFERIIGGDGCELTVCRADPQVEAPPKAFYAANEDLPADVRGMLPLDAQTVYRRAFNRA